MKRLKKKTHKKISSSKKPKRSISHRLIFFITFFVLFIGALFFPQIWQLNHPCANSISCANNLNGNYENSQTTGIFMGQRFSAPKEIAQDSFISSVLGDSTLPKVIKVDLTTQHLYAYEGSNLVYDFVISSGKWGKTPTGTFTIWIKLRYTRMVGGNAAIGTYYNLPNVPYTMFFSNDEVAKSQGYSIHGAYWHHNFGHPMSHGCVNMQIPDAETIFNWADPPTAGPTTYASDTNQGTKVIIYGTPPAT